MQQALAAATAIWFVDSTDGRGLDLPPLWPAFPPPESPAEGRLKPAQQPVARALLRGLAVAYGRLVALRNRFYDQKGRTHRAALPVLSVGNITVGGTGKTPMVAWIVERLLAQGRRPAVVSRGYGGRAGAGPVVVSEGAGPLCPAAKSGDEPWLLARGLSGAIVIVGARPTERFGESS